MKKRADKEKDFAILREELGKTNNIFLTNFEKMKVSQDFQLRKIVKEAGGEYRVVKNNLVQKASEGLGSEPLFNDLKGMTSMAYTSGDVVALVKALSGYAKTNPVFSFRAGLVEGRVIDLKSIADLVNMPPKEEIYAKLLWLIQAPAQRIVTAVNGVGRNVAVVIDQAVQQEKFPG